MLHQFLKRFGSVKTQKIIFTVILVISFLAIIFITVGQQRSCSNENKKYAEAVITSVSTYSTKDKNGNNIQHYDATLTFAYKNQKYINIAVDDVPSVEIGSKVTVSFPEEDPTRCTVVSSTFNIGLFLLYLVFVFFMVISLAVILSISQQQHKKKQKLIRDKTEEQHRKDQEETNILLNEAYHLEPNPFDNDTTDYSDMFNHYDVTDSFSDAETAYTDYNGTETSPDTASGQPYGGTEDYSSYMPNGGLDSYADPFAIYTGENNPPPPPYGGAQDDSSYPAGSGLDSYADPFAPYTGYDDNSLT